jgi:anti-sigma factor RsiW
MYGTVGGLVVGVCSVLFFIHGARQERLSPALWGGLSLAAWVLVLLLLGGGVVWTLLGQLLVYGLLFVHLERRRAKSGKLHE